MENTESLIAKWREEYPRKTAKMFNEMLDELETSLHTQLEELRKQSSRWKEMYELASADRAKLETKITLEALRAKGKK